MANRLIILVVIAVVSLAACRGRTAQAPGEPRFASVVLTDDKDSKAEKTSFAPDTPNVYAVFMLADVPANSNIKSVWIAEKTDVAAENYKIDETSLTMGGSANSGNFSLSRPTNGWPAGQYRVEFYIGEKLAHTARFQVEASGAAPPPATPPPTTTAATTPFASKGWVFENGVYVNAQHNLRVQVPTGWVTGNEQRYSERILWVMSRLDASGNERLGANMSHIRAQATSEQFFLNELQDFKGVTYQQGTETKPLWTVTGSGKIKDDLYALEHVRNDNGTRGRNLNFVRNGFGYVIAFKWAANATPEELTELNRVAWSMGYGDMNFATSIFPAAATPQTPRGPSTAVIGDIIFAPNLQNERPVGAAKRFGQGTKRVYAFFPFRDMRPDDKVEAVWFKDGEEVYTHKTTLTEVLGGNIKPNGNLWFWLSWTNSAPPGSYRVEIRVNGQPARTGTFEVSS
jgi:hypothetical protein